VTASTRLTELLTPVVADAGFDLEGLTVSAAGKRSVVRVQVDKDGGVTLDDVADVSRVLSQALDEVDERDPSLLGASYVLEVSSPGVDRPLTEPRHWRRNATRRVSATLRDGGTVDGRIVRADAEAVVLDVGGSERVLTYPELVKGAVQVEFGRPAAGDDEAGDDPTGDPTGDEADEDGQEDA